MSNAYIEIRDEPDTATDRGNDLEMHGSDAGSANIPPSIGLSSSAASSAAPASSAQPEPDVCRICRTEDDRHLLITPCNCSGSLAHVHSSCLERWIATRPLTEEEQQRMQLERQQAEREAEDDERFQNNSQLSSSLQLLAVRDGRLTCEICHSEYRIDIEWIFQFQFRRCLEWQSLGHFCEMIIVLGILAIGAAFIPVLSNRPNEQPLFSDGSDQYLIPMIAASLILLASITLWKVFQRWKRANSTIKIRPYNRPHGINLAPNRAAAT